MQTNHVDKLIYHLDNVLAPIWTSVILYLEEAPTVRRLKDAVYKLVEYTVPLNMIWNKKLLRWEKRENWNIAEIQNSIIITDYPVNLKDVYCTVDLSNELAFRVIFSTHKTNRGYGLAIQLHHVRGDGRSLLMLLNNLLSYAGGVQGREISDNRTSDFGLFKKTIKRLTAKNLRNFFNPKYDFFASRGVALPTSGDGSHGKPCVDTIKLNLNKISHLSGIDLFYSSVAIGISELLGVHFDLPIRLRIPVDLRREFSLQGAIGNFDTAIALEISSGQLIELRKNAEQNINIFTKEIRKILNNKHHLTNFIESIILTSLLSSSYLKKTLKKDFFSKRRNNTMVATFLGKVDRNSRQFPFKINDVIVTVPTLGANGYIFNGHLYINITSYDGIWNHELRNKFLLAIERWINLNFGLKTYRLSMEEDKNEKLPSC